VTGGSRPRLCCVAEVRRDRYFWLRSDRLERFVTCVWSVENASVLNRGVILSVFEPTFACAAGAALVVQRDERVRTEMGSGMLHRACRGL
jgi:hypothetical protein